MSNVIPDISFANVFAQITILLLVTAAVGAIFTCLRQPLIVAFVAVGILVGPSGLGWITVTDEIHFLSELGLALLLFAVGLKLDLSLIRSMGPVALAAGLGQVAFTSIIGYFICLALGMTSVTAIYVAMALTFSSTIIVVKLLSDKRETDSLHGRIAVGLLIVQDILVVLVMIVLSAFAGSDNALQMQFVLIIAKGAALLAIIGILMYFVFPRLLNYLAHSPELLVLFAISWAVAVASTSAAMGFSREVGAFIAGVSLASTQYREMLGTRLVSLRDFLLLFFFVELGGRLDLRLLGNQVWGAIPLSLFVLLGNPLIVMVIMGIMGYRKRTSFLTGLTVAQISEFSLILAVLGLGLGHIGDDVVGLITLVGFITIGLSTYMIIYSHQIYGKLSSYLGPFERSVQHREQALDMEYGVAQHADTVVFGLGRYGTAVSRELMKQGRTVLGVDFDPQAVKRWNSHGWPAWFGDAEDPEFPAALPLSNIRWVVSSIRDEIVNRALINAISSHGYRGSIAATANNPSEASSLQNTGADLVFVPFTDAASQAVEKLIQAEQQELRRMMDKFIAGLKDHYIVCGYGRMGRQIVKDFEQYNVPYVVIEWNPEQLPDLAAHNIPHIEGRATDDDVLLRAGVDRAKGLIAVTATDEENVFIVLTARGLNPDLCIVARSIQQENEQKLIRAGADRVLSPYIVGGHRMASAVLSPEVTDFLEMVLPGQHPELEITAVPVTQAAPFADKPLNQSQIRETAGVNVLAIREPDGAMHTNPHPDTVIHPEDQLIVMGTPAQIEAARKMARGE